MRPTINLSSWRLDPDGLILREPPRPPAYRGRGYEEDFDYTTVFCDTFWSADGHSIFLVGPPLANLEDELGLRFASKPSNAVCEHKIHRHDRLDRIEVAAPPDTTHLLVETSLGETVLTPQPNLADMFRDKRVIITKNKNNDLTWIYDWSLFHQRNHGCDAILIYDNGSTQYTSDEIVDALSDIDGLDEVAVIDWPFPWGPIDGLWDSQFCKLTLLEHARLRCLSEAKSVLQVDVDELVVTKKGESVFALAERSGTGYLRYAGLWVESIENSGKQNGSTGEDVPRHRNFCFVRSDTGSECEHKWVCVPARNRPATQWLIHEIVSLDIDHGDKDASLESLISLRHFKAINTGWKVKRSAPETFNTLVHRLDHELKKTLDTVFGNSPENHHGAISTANDPLINNSAPQTNGPSGPQRDLEAAAFCDRSTPARNRLKIAENVVEENPNDPRLRYLLALLQRRCADIGGAVSSLRSAADLDATYVLVHRMLGGIYARQGRIEDAINAIRSAVELDPNYVAGHQLLSRLHCEAGQIGEAIAAASRALALRPKDPGLHNQLGNLLEAQGEIDEAIAAQLQAVELGMDGPGMHRKLAVLHAQRGKYGEAIKCINRSLMRYGARCIMGIADADGD